MKKVIFVCILMTGISMMLFAGSDTDAKNNNMGACGAMLGHWYGEGTLIKSFNCTYEVNAYVTLNTPNLMSLKLRSTANNPLCKQYYSEDVLVNCDDYNISLTSQKVNLNGYFSYDYNNADLKGTLRSRLHYHQFELNLHKN